MTTMENLSRKVQKRIKLYDIGQNRCTQTHSHIAHAWESSPAVKEPKENSNMKNCWNTTA